MREDEARLIVTEALAEVAPDIDVADLDPDEPFQEQADLDSLDLLRVLELIEVRAGVSMPTDGPAVRTISGLTTHLVGTGR